MRFIWLALIAGILMSVLSSQLIAQDFPRDTSYTIRSAYEKYVKRHPEIQIADPELENQVSIQRNIPYKDTGVRDLSLDVFRPLQNSAEVHPAAIMVHGGGWISGDKSLLHPMAKALASRGFIAITVEYRLSPEAEYPAAVYDVKSAIKWVKDHSVAFGVDTQRVAILGTSAGGQIAALVGTTQEMPQFEDPADSSKSTTSVFAVIDVDGVLAFIHPDSEEGTVAGKWLGGNPSDARDTWIEASALTHANSETPPTLFIGSSSPRFLAGNEEFMEILSSANIYSEKQVFEDAPHSFWLFHPWFEPTIKHIDRFLSAVL